MGDRRIASGKRRIEGDKKVRRYMGNTMIKKMEVVRGKVQQKLKLFEGFISIGVGGDGNENVYGESVSRKRRQSSMQEGDIVTSASKRKKNGALFKQKEVFIKKT